MNYYIDINLTPNAAIPINRLLNSVYTNLHKVLWDMQSTEVGASFPNSKLTLGCLLRLHGSMTLLSQIETKDWLGEERENCALTSIQSVPANSKHRKISRKQSTMSESKLRRLIKRGSITDAEAKAYRAKMFAKGLDNPYVELVSASNGKKHRRYIEFGPLLDEPIEGNFDTFGLSKTATVPWF